jgi:hypothetical protein
MISSLRHFLRWVPGIAMRVMGKPCSAWTRTRPKAVRFTSWRRRRSPSPSWGGVRGGGNPSVCWLAARRRADIYLSAIPPTLSLPHQGGGYDGVDGCVRLASRDDRKSTAHKRFNVVPSALQNLIGQPRTRPEDGGRGWGARRLTSCPPYHSIHRWRGGAATTRPPLDLPSRAPCPGNWRGR